MLPEVQLQRDLETVRAQLGRAPRGVVDIAYRCPCGCPAVVRTRPELDDGTPFPTLFYATCPALTAAVSRLESQGMMAEMTGRLNDDPDGPLAHAYRAAHEDYLRRRDALGTPARIAGVSAGGMPTRVKCLHVLVAHSLAAGPGVNPLGDEAVAALGAWWSDGCCREVPGAHPATSEAGS